MTQTITITKRSENIRAASSKRRQDNILNKLLAHSQEFHYSNLSFASAGLALDLSNHRKIAQLKQVTSPDAQQDRNSFQKEECSPPMASYSEASTAHDRDVRQQHTTLPLEEHPSGPAEGLDLGITPPTLQQLLFSDKSEPTHWSLATDRKMQSGTSLLTGCQAQFHISLKVRDERRR